MLVAHSKFADAVTGLRQLRHRRSLTMGVGLVLLALTSVVWAYRSYLSDTTQTVLGSIAGLVLIVFAFAGLEWRKYSRIVLRERTDGHIRRASSVTRSRLGKLGRSCGFVPSADDLFELQRVADHAQSSWIGERRDELDAMRKRS